MFLCMVFTLLLCLLRALSCMLWYVAWRPWCCHVCCSMLKFGTLLWNVLSYCFELCVGRCLFMPMRLQWRGDATAPQYYTAIRQDFRKILSWPCHQCSPQKSARKPHRFFHRPAIYFAYFGAYIQPCFSRCAGIAPRFKHMIPWSEASKDLFNFLFYFWHHLANSDCKPLIIKELLTLLL